MLTALALGAALAYGVADFLGGAVARRATALRVLVWSIPAGLTLLIIAAALSGGTLEAAPMTWGLVSGIAGGTGLITFYRALARGPMSVVAPVSALAAAVLPVGAGALRGERLQAGVLLGVVLCVIAIGLVSMEESRPANAPRPDPPHPPSRPNASHAPSGGVGTYSRAAGWRVLDSGPVLAGVSGTAFGIFLVMLKEAGTAESGLWPLVAARSTGLLVVVGTILVVARLRPTGGDPARLRGAWMVGLALLSGVLDAGGNVLYFISARDGTLSLAAVLTSLYPAITVLLARIFYSERLRTIQRVGLGVALAGVTLVTVG